MAWSQCSFNASTVPSCRSFWHRPARSTQERRLDTSCTGMKAAPFTAPNLLQKAVHTSVKPNAFRRQIRNQLCWQTPIYPVLLRSPAAKLQHSFCASHMCRGKSDLPGSTLYAEDRGRMRQDKIQGLVPQNLSSYRFSFLVPGELVVGDGSHGWYAVQLKSDAGRPKFV